jgi:hypothetical protein
MVAGRATSGWSEREEPMAAQGTVEVKDIEVFAQDLDPRQAAAIYREHGCLVVRGLMVRGFRPYMPEE